MATQVQLRRGTATENNSFTGAQGELTFDTTNKRVRIHDGATAGGFELKTENSSGDTLFADNEKAIFGAGSDLQIYHSGSHSVIKDAGDGNLQLIANDFQLRNGADNANMMTGANGGAVTLMHNGSSKLATTSTGIDVTGDVGGDSLTINNSGQSQSLLSVGGGSTNAALRLRGSTGSAYAWQISSNAYLASALEFTKSTAAGGTTFSTPSMILDNSGNLLLGKTDTSIATQGVFFGPNYSHITSTNDTPLALSRKSSDGIILDIRKDGTTVGSIGNDSTDTIYIGSGDVALAFQAGADAVIPWNTSNVVRDNAIDLGRSIARFKDLYLSSGVKWTEGQVEINSGRLLQRSTGDASGLRFDGSGYTPFKNGSVADGTVDLGYSSGRYNNLYLSGGVYLGGVVGANKLEDYEEGTWTPTLLGASSNPTVGYVLQTGHYTKIGNTVNLYCRLQTNSRSGGSGTALIGGLPFAHNSARAGGSLGYISGVNLSSGYSQFGLSGDTVSSTIRYIQSGDNIGSNIINVTEVASSSNHDIVFTYTYQTDA